jgi:hypothetical protein
LHQEGVIENQSQQDSDNCNKVALSQPDLSHLIDLPPEEFQAGLAKHLQNQIVAGMPDLPAMRSIKDLATLVALHSKVSGMDRKGQGKGVTLIVQPPRNVSRKPRAAETTLDLPPEDPAPESLEEYEV